jgi:predicted acetyltransferase
VTLVLRRLAIEDEADVKAGVAELEAEGGRWSSRHRSDISWPTYVELVHGWEDGRDLPPGDSPVADLVAEVDGVVVGRCAIRTELDDFHRVLGGHVGYAVRPRFRGRGYATEMLRERGVDRVLVTCDDDNLASAKVIEANGGVLEGVVPGVADVPKRRYWIG